MPRLGNSYRFVVCAALLVTVSTVRPAMAEGDVTIGFAAASTGWPWYVSFIKRFNEKATANAWKTTVLSANADVPTQLNQIHDLVAKKVNYLVVGPIDGAAVIPGIKAAHEAGIPVIVIGNPVTKEGEDYVTATRVPDDGQMGRGSAELVAQANGFSRRSAVFERAAPASFMSATSSMRFFGSRIGCPSFAREAVWRLSTRPKPIATRSFALW
jgi:ABC-type sugar transport system substrate-binding protein